MAGVRGALPGGWQLSGVTTMQGGLPITVGVGFDTSRTGLSGFNARPIELHPGRPQITLPGATAIRRTLADARQIQFGMKLIFWTRRLISQFLIASGALCGSRVLR